MCLEDLRTDLQCFMVLAKGLQMILAGQVNAQSRRQVRKIV